MAEKKTEKKAAEPKAVKTVVDFDTTAAAVQTLLDTQIAQKLIHKDEFKLVYDDGSAKGKTIAYFHIRKYSIDVYVPDRLEGLLPQYQRFPSPCKNFSRIYVNDGNELFNTLTIVYDTYATAQKKKEAEAKKAAEAKKKKPAKKSAA